MSKITNRSALLFLSLGLFSFSFITPVFSASKVFTAHITLPSESLDFSDLDVRDEFNRPVKDSAVARAFASSVQAVLLKTLVENLTPNNQFIKNILSLNHDVVCGWIKRAVQKNSETFQAVLSTGKKWILFVLSSKSMNSISAPVRRGNFSHNNFSYLISSLLSSTRILR